MESGPHVDEYILLYRLETKLRQLIEKLLPKISDTWWEDCIPDSVKSKVAKRMTETDLAPWFKTNYDLRLPETYYLNLRDYKKIIIAHGNWERAFEKVFHYKGFIIQRLEKIKPIRDSVMHPKPLRENQKQDLVKASEEIIKCIEEWDIINERYIRPAQEALLAHETDTAITVLTEGLKRTTSEDKPHGDPWLAFWLGKAFEERKDYRAGKDLYKYAAKTLPLSSYRKMAENKLREVEKKEEKAQLVCPNCGHRFEA